MYMYMCTYTLDEAMCPVCALLLSKETVYMIKTRKAKRSNTTKSKGSSVIFQREVYQAGCAFPANES